MQQRIFSVMKQEVCIVFTVLSFFNPYLVCLQQVLILRLHYRCGPNYAELNVLALLYKPCWPGLVQLTSAQFMTVYTVKQTLSLSLYCCHSLLTDLLPLACHSFISHDLSSSFVISFLSQGLCPSSEKFCTYTHGITAESENASLNLIGYILSIPCMHSLWYSHAVSRTTHCVEEEALDGCSRNYSSG